MLTAVAAFKFNGARDISTLANQLALGLRQGTILVLCSCVNGGRVRSGYDRGLQIWRSIDGARSLQSSDR
jgi:hypothetical protein